MSVVGIIPVRSFSLGKQRLAGALSDTRRSVLGERLANHVAVTVADSGVVPLLVTADVTVAEWAIRNGFPSIEDPSTGLDDAIAVGINWALTSGSDWLAIHADLPLIDRTDMNKLIGVLDSGGQPIAPSVDGGTSVIGSNDTFEPAYGPGSFHTHLARLSDPVVVTTTGLLHDIDSVAALASAADHPKGAWLWEFLK